MSVVTISTIRVLKRYKFLCSTMAKKLEENNPCDYKQAMNTAPIFNTTTFLRDFTPEQIAKSPRWSLEYVRVTDARFPLGEPAIQGGLWDRGFKCWGYYLNFLATGGFGNVSKEDQAWAKEQMELMNDSDE